MGAEREGFICLHHFESREQFMPLVVIIVYITHMGVYVSKTGATKQQSLWEVKKK